MIRPLPFRLRLRLHFLDQAIFPQGPEKFLVVVLGNLTVNPELTTYLVLNIGVGEASFQQFQDS